MAIDKIQTVVLGSLADLNQQLPEELKVPASVDVVIIGEEAAIDSLSLAGLLIDIEDKLKQNLQIKVSLLDEGLNSTFGFKFQTVKQMIDWIDKQSSGGRE